MSRRGYTVAELVVALALAGLVAGAAVRLLGSTRRLHDGALARMEAQFQLRSAAAILAAQLRESELLALRPDVVAYRAARGLFRVCARSPDDRTLILEPGAVHGRSSFDATEYDLRLLDSATGSWWTVTPIGSGSGRSCPGGAPSLDVRLAATTPALIALPPGAPVRVVRARRLRRYRGGDGRWWIGSQEWVREAASWSITQPVAGPITADGLAFTFLTAAGSETTDPASVRRIVLQLRAAVGDGGAAAATAAVALRGRSVP